MWLHVPSSMCSPSALAQGGSTSAFDWRVEMLSPSVTLKTKLAPRTSWLRAWKKAAWMKRQFGRIYEHSTADAGVESWIAFLAATRASPSRLPESNEARLTHVISGLPLKNSSLLSDRASVSLRTCRIICGLDSQRFEATYEKWATSLRQDCLRRKKLARRMSASDCSSWQWRTPTALSTPSGVTYNPPGQAQLDLQAKQWPTPMVPNGGRVVPKEAVRSGNAAYLNGKKIQVGLEDSVRHWPTPRASPNENRTTKNAPSHGSGHGLTLAGVACNWGTPTALDAGGRTYTYTNGDKEKPFLTLCGQAELWPDSDPSLLGVQTTTDGSTSSPPTRRLNPHFVEWLMGMPIGWTGFDSAATESYHSWLQRHSTFFVKILDELSSNRKQDISSAASKRGQATAGNLPW
jgi:hypothetical protein